MNKKICFTIDVEPDFGGLTKSESYDGLGDMPKINEIVKKYDLKLTAFVTGKTLEENDWVVESLGSMGAEIEQHSYSHSVGKGKKIKDIQKGIEVHEKLFGRLPNGYRAPEGVITKEEVLFLDEVGIKFDASIFPSFFPGRFNRLNFPLTPFKIDELDLIEIPFAVLPRIRIPIGLSYLQLLGINTFKILSKIFELPNILVFDFHSYEFSKIPSYQHLPLFSKIGYFRAQRMYADPTIVFEKFVEYILSKGYESKYLIDVYQEIKPNVSSWRWKGD